jgi:23S rRNA (uracil1939-C5)-methyltransferase
VSLARDAALLSDAGYALERVIVVDLFPQTHHVETVARFVHE